MVVRTTPAPVSGITQLIVVIAPSLIPISKTIMMCSSVSMWLFGMFADNNDCLPFPVSIGLVLIKTKQYVFYFKCEWGNGTTYFLGNMDIVSWPLSVLSLSNSHQNKPNMQTYLLDPRRLVRQEKHSTKSSYNVLQRAQHAYAPLSSYAS